MISTLEKIYAGLLGMDAGMLLGAPVENPFWTYERLESYFGNMSGYLRKYKHYAADDDINGPVIFLRALTDRTDAADFTAEDAGETWLNYTRCGHGMFWWGGEDVATEHRAYMNLRRGIPAPESGSAAQNGTVASEQIGGQIFIDTWGLINPGNPGRAAKFARTAASVSHDGEGLHGAAFMAACVAAAFESNSVDDIIDTGLRFIPENCEYRRAVDAVRVFYAEHPSDFRACREFVAEEFSEEKYPGVCHIIPNAAICTLGLLYGGGDLGRSIEICVMCGFDTDCNSCNIGTVLGVMNGVVGIPARYRGPINDACVLSSVSGYLNMLDIPTFAKELYAVACRLQDEPLPAEVRLPVPGELLFDFALPGSTHGLELSDEYSHELRWSPFDGGCAEIQIDGENPPPTDLFFKGCYQRADFNDERYEPVFAPRAYPGRTVRAEMYFDRTASDELAIVPYLTTAEGERICFGEVKLPEGKWTEISFTVPELHGTQVHNLGWEISTIHHQQKWAWDRVRVKNITVTGKADYTIAPARHRKELGTVTPFAFNDGTAELENGEMSFVSERDAQGFTGNYYTRDVCLTADATLVSGSGPMLIVRGQGTRRYYALGFAAPDRLAIQRYDAGTVTELGATPCQCISGENLRLEATAEGNKLKLAVNGTVVLTAEDDRFAYGMCGIAHAAAAITQWRGFHVQEL